MKILQLCPKIPYPLTDGGSIAMFNITKELSFLGHEVHMVGLSRVEMQPPAELLEHCNLTIIPHDSKTTLSGAIAAMFSRDPYTTSKYWNFEVERQIVDIATRGNFDLVHVDQLHMARYGKAVGDALGIPFVIRQQNVETTIVERFYKVQRNPLVRAYAWLEHKKLSKYESAACGRADLNVMITEVDRDRLQEMNDAVKTAVSPAGVDTDYFHGGRWVRSDEAESDLVILSIASMDWYPNVDAVLWFLDEVLPTILEINPSAVFQIVGRGIPDSIRKRESSNVRVIGFVDDIRPYMENASVMVVPLRIGGGMRLKILDALAMGKAVVSTPVGCEGIDVTDGLDIAIAKDSSEFASLTSVILSDTVLRNKLGDSGRDLVLSKYSWSKIIANLASEYAQLVGSGD